MPQNSICVKSIGSHMPEYPYMPAPRHHGPTGPAQVITSTLNPKPKPLFSGPWSLNHIYRPRGPSKQVADVFKFIWGIFESSFHVESETLRVSYLDRHFAVKGSDFLQLPNQ